jgi:hypothetical protein
MLLTMIASIKKNMHYKHKSSSLLKNLAELGPSAPYCSQPRLDFSLGAQLKSFLGPSRNMIAVCRAN